MSAVTTQQIERSSRQLRLSESGHPVLTYNSEADIRINLAKLAYAYGWDVEQEVVIPGWGRIDLVVSDTSPGSILIELKLALNKPSEVRRGFQQADGYGRWWVANRGEPAQAVLAAADASAGLVAPVAVAYPEVQFHLVNHVMAGLAVWGSPTARVGVAQARADGLSNLLEIHDHAVNRLVGQS